MRAQILAMGLLSLVTAACSSAPTPGAWSYREFGASRNTCNSDQVIDNGGGGFRLKDLGGGAYQVQPNDNSSPFSCTLDGDAMSCPDRANETVPVTGFSAELVVDVQAEATVLDSESMEGTQDGTVTCTGTGCATVASAAGMSFPCNFSVNFTADLVAAD
jgi:hypothetical protein